MNTGGSEDRTKPTMSIGGKVGIGLGVSVGSSVGSGAGVLRTRKLDPTSGAGVAVSSDRLCHGRRRSDRVQRRGRFGRVPSAPGPELSGVCGEGTAMATVSPGALSTAGQSESPRPRTPSAAASP